MKEEKMVNKKVVQKQLIYPALLIMSLLLSQVCFAEYINPNIPAVKITSYEGQRYEAIVPDTLDIAEHAKMSIHGLTSPLDPNDEYSLYWLVNFHNNPPIMEKEPLPHIMSLRSKFMESLPLMRIITGSNLNSNVDQVWMNSLVKMIGPDGLFYVKTSEKDDFRTLSSCAISRLTATMMLYYLHSKEDSWIQKVQRIADRYDELAVDKGDYAYFTQKYFKVNEKPDKSIPMQTGVWAVDEMNSRMIQQLGRYYIITGYEPAKKLGNKLFNYVRFHSQYFGPNGEWLKDQLDPNIYPGRGEDNHFGTHSHVLHYLTEFAIAIGDTEKIEYCKKSFEWAIKRNSTIEGQSDTATRIGFFLEYLNPYYPTGETCSVSDMISIGLKLSAAGAGDYWNDVDGWIRNHYISCQIAYADWTERLKSPQWPRKPESDETDDHVAERNVGNFFSWPTANDGCPSRPAIGEHWACPIGIMHCCTGNGSRTLYYIWQNILSFKDDTLKVNLLLNRASQWADLDSFIPYHGKVDLKIKKQLKAVLVRMPEWIPTESDKVKCLINNIDSNFRWIRRYIELPPVKENDVITLTFPIIEKVLVRRVYGDPHETMIGGVDYERIIFRGNTIVLIDPQGKNYPFYQRQHYRNSEPRFKKVERFISYENINW